MRRVARVLGALVCLSLIGAGGLGLWGYLSERGTARDSYAELETYVQLVPTGTPAPSAVAAPSPEPAPERPEVDFAALSEINPDVAAWLICEGTELSYPVVRGEDNEYYLTHLFNGTPGASGCLFLDSRTEGGLSERHSIIYGHHMKDGSMFAALDGYKEQEFYEEHPTLLLLTPEGDFEAEVFSAGVAPTSSDAWRLDFPDEADFASWLSAVVESSAITTALTPSPADRILTLSTCSYEYPDARLVVHTVLRPLSDK